MAVFNEFKHELDYSIPTCNEVIKNMVSKGRDNKSTGYTISKETSIFRC